MTTIKKERVIENIELLAQNLAKITDDTGEFLLDFDGLIVDDKSWHVWNWPQGVGLYGLYQYWQLTKSETAIHILTEWFDQRLMEGSPPKNVNTMAPLLTMAYLYQDQGKQEYLPYLEQWADWVMFDMPRTDEDGLQHMTYGPENKNQLWADTLMMTVLPLAKIGQLLNRSDYIEEAKRQFLLHIKYLADKQTGLWFHGWTFEGHHNFASALWGRGNCWATISIPEIIDMLDLRKGDFLFDYLVSTLTRQVEALEKLQHQGGLWHTLVDDSSSYLEASASAGFTYGILKAIRKRYLPKRYLPVAERALEAIINEINDQGALEKVSIGTGMGDDLDFYREIDQTTMPYGQSLAILCLTEYLYIYA
ncbi:unsaturated rhamnogalacturonyl hydrolase [Amphibacillus marinus]|uniref:Unsaturated rhamnogalacturonyl hydrolase n=1 Tax=Amphibacillus marinus TaxID=872970 RepID=A0A1H8H6H0_9BACI|nr:glycoside hydrolase family 88 protein [Amphibacillus marinus]SEN51594.1 unsaturated rhamnogalacturonyl hydrolase [Amphibacillus marinus]